jgi:hypothetical protein
LKILIGSKLELAPREAPFKPSTDVEFEVASYKALQRRDWSWLTNFKEIEDYPLRSGRKGCYKVA